MLIIRKLSLSQLTYILDFYEEDYLYFSNILNYNKKLICSKKYIEIDNVNNWLKENYKSDIYTKVIPLPKIFNKTKKDMILIDKMPHKIQYIKIIYFSELNLHTIKNAILTSDSNYLILDLRDCAGGSVNTSIQIANSLIRKGEICSLQFRTNTQKIESEGFSKKFQAIFLMVNKFTMSSAELLMMALFLNLDNVYIVGSKTFRKNIGQKTVIAKNKKTMLKYSAFEWKVKERSILDFENIIRSSENYINLPADARYNEFMLSIYSIVKKFY